ncbi:hypothetical protein D7T58_19240 [Stenotrophomonas maltophilia]|uniref:hypothetical protein n=1 Tax=Stenotrophomonas hibiscicola TaxID=86189 RepID=UPI0015DFE515|nr:hypothetical protein [Stenotrophomonas maltophilia]MBA0470805.1 hypothetical protein [Stenotrophomonas maltophilia]MBA0478125.1 hypothetical protein [Stenotrophomonas maltophilia]MBA0486758.1 hypothetical protein [Stenotrophomonas maltophilia]
MRAAGKAWISVVVLVAGIALLPGLLYLLGLALAGGRPKPADRVPSGVAACSSEPRAGYHAMNPWRFTAQFFDKDVMKKVPEVEREAFWIARRHLWRQPQRGMLRWHLSGTALTIWITRHWSTSQIADTARKEDFCRTGSKQWVSGGPMNR